MTNNIKGITIELGGNVENLNSALKGVNKTAGDLQSELKQVQRQLKFNPGNTELLNQKAKILKESISATEQKLEHLKSVEAKVTKQFEDGKISPEKYRAFERELEQTEDKLKSLKKQAADFGSTMGQQFQVAGGKIKNTGDKVSGVGQKFAPVSAAAAGIGVAAVKAADNFESGMAKVSTIADTTQVPINKLKQSIMDLSSQTGISTSELTDGLYQTISAGVQTKDAMSVLGVAVETAKGGFTDTSTAIDTLTSAINAYHMKASDAAKVSDTLIATQNVGKTTVGELGQSIGNVIPTAAAAGVKFTDLMGSIAELTKQGMPTSEAITGIKTAISNVIKPSADASKEAAKLGLDFSEAHMKNVGLPTFLQEVQNKTGGNITTMGNLFGSVEGLNAVTALTGKNQKDFAKTLESVGKSAGTTNQAFGKMESTGAVSAEKAMNSMKNAAAKLGEALAPIAEKIASIITQIGKRLQALTPAQQQMIAKALLLTAALAPVLIVGGQIIRGIGSFTDGLGKAIGAVGNFNSTIRAGKGLFAALKVSLGPGGIAVLIIAAIALIVVGIKHLWDTNEGFRTAVTSIWNGIKNTLQAIGKWFSGPFVNFFKTAINGIKSFFTGIPAFFTGIWSGIQSAATAAWNGIRSAVMAIITPFIAAIKAPFNTLKTGLSNILNGIKSIFTGVWTVIKNVVGGIAIVLCDILSGHFDKLGSDLSHILSNIASGFSTVWSGIKSVTIGIVQALVGAVGTIFSGGVSVINSIGNGLKSFFSSLWNGIKSAASSAWNGITGVVRSAWNGMVNFLRNPSAIYNAIKSAFTSAINWIKDLPGEAIQWGKDLIDGIANGIKSAASAVGNAVQGVAQNIRSFLHFSVPDEGPLVDYQSWMPDFMQGLADGINTSKYKVAQSIQGLASDMSISPAVRSAAGEYSAQTIDNSVTKAPVININGPVSVQDKGSRNATLQQLQFLAEV